MRWRAADVEGIAAAAHVSVVDASHALDVLGSGLLGKLAKEQPAAAGLMVAAMVKFAAASGGEAEPSQTPGPVDWQEHSRRVLAGYESDRRRLLTIFGRDEPLTEWQSIAPLLKAMEQPFPARGPFPLLRYPVEAPGGERRVAVLPVDEGRPEAADEDVRPPASPLWELLSLSEKIARETGLPPADAVAWLLAAEDVSLPWVEVRAHLRPNGVHTYTLQVGSLSVTPDEVAAAWSRVRQDAGAAVFGADAQKADELRAHLDRSPEAYRRAKTTDRVAVMVAFVDAWDLAHKGERRSWPALAAMFAEAHPEFPPFKHESMRNQYRHTKARQASKGGAHNG